MPSTIQSIVQPFNLTSTILSPLPHQSILYIMNSSLLQSQEKNLHLLQFLIVERPRQTCAQQPPLTEPLQASSTQVSLETRIAIKRGKHNLKAHHHTIYPAKISPSSHYPLQTLLHYTLPPSPL